MSGPETEALREVLEDVRRHLQWQEGEGGAHLLVEQGAARQARAALTSTVPASSPAAPLSAGGSLKERFLAQQGVPQRPAARPAAPEAPPARPAFTPPPAAAPTQVQAEAAPTRRTLDEVRREVGDCRRCKLCQGRKNIVFGVGNPRAQLVFVGEGPGAEEDTQGVPFVGAAGQLLTKMIEAMGFSRDDVYICNVVKCRPPNNRNPEPDEIAACEPFLKAQLASLQPKVIVALGKFAAQTLLRDDTSITRLRGQWREYEGIQLMPTFHPAYLLRSPEQKRHAWADLQQVMKVFGKAPQGKGAQGGEQ